MSADQASTVRVAPRGAPAQSVVDQATAKLLPDVDVLWRNIYHVTELIAEVNSVRFWKAHCTDTAEEVVLRVAPGAQSDARVEAWPRLCAVELPQLQRVREVHFIAGCQVEVCDPVVGLPLDVWRGQRSSVDLATVEAVVRQLAEALGVLHSSGLVHLGLRTGVVFVREGPDGLHCTLGGLETVSRFEGQRLVPAFADPLYAPPEAATLQLHEPGPALCGWDWWSLGRVAQELILGHHVVDSVLATPQSAPLRSARAEELLLELEAGGPRAGAVEVMVGLDPRLELLLRGLLASAPEVRWGSEFVDRWVRQKSVKEQYSQSRPQLKFCWRGRLFSVPEAAQALQTPALWSEAASHLFEKEKSGTLVHYLRHSPTQAASYQQLEELSKLAEVEPLLSLPPALAREVLQALLLAQLSGTTFVWRGCRCDGARLHTLLLEEDDNPEQFALVRAFTHRTVTTHLERYDTEAGRSLAAIERAAVDAEAIIRRQDWLNTDDTGLGEKIFRLALKPEPSLSATRERLQRDFAGSKNAEVAGFLKNARPSRAELVALAWVEPNAAQCGFITHAENSEKELQILRQRGGQLTSALCWARLGRSLEPGALLSGPWLASALGWGTAAALVAVTWPGLPGLVGALALCALAVIVRAGVFLALRATLSRFAPTSPKWTFKDGVARCRAELQTGGRSLDAKGLENALGNLRAEFAQHTLNGRSAPSLDESPHFVGLRVISLASWVVLLGLYIGSGWHLIVHPPAWSRPPVAISGSGKVNRPGTPAIGTVENATTTDRGPEAGVAPAAVAGGKIAWPYKLGHDADIPAVKSTVPATDAQIEFAVKHGRALIAPYIPETVTATIVLRVPAGDAVAVMFFDSIRGKLVNENVYVIAFRPRVRAWVQVGDRIGFFLDE